MAQEPVPEVAVFDQVPVLGEDLGQPDQEDVQEGTTLEKAVSAEARHILVQASQVLARAEEVLKEAEEVLQRANEVAMEVREAAERTVSGIGDFIIEAVRVAALREVDPETTLAAVRAAVAQAVEQGMAGAEARVIVAAEAVEEVRRSLEETGRLLKVEASDLLDEGDCVVDWYEAVVDGRTSVRLEKALKQLEEKLSGRSVEEEAGP